MPTDFLHFYLICLPYGYFKYIPVTFEFDTEKNHSQTKTFFIKP